MDLIYILLLLIGGLAFIVLELVAIPGTSIAGLLGLALTIYGIVRVYAEYGNTWGTISLFVSLIIILILLFYSLRTKTWKRFTLNDSIDSRVNEIEEENFKVGDKGITITRLASAGIAEINNQRIEVYSVTSYIDPKTDIEIDSIKDKRIFVKPIEQERI